MRKEINFAYGYGNKKKNMRVVTRVAIGFRAGYHHVKVNVENKNTLLKIHYRNKSDHYKLCLHCFLNELYR